MTARSTTSGEQDPDRAKLYLAPKSGLRLLLRLKNAKTANGCHSPARFGADIVPRGNDVL